MPTIRDFVGMPTKITAILAGESDRGTILVLAAYLEELLGFIVRAACVSDADADKILEFRGPAGGFDLKIQLCKALGLIHSEEVQGLQAVRKIRNSAAHFDTKRGFDVLFDTESTIAHVANLAESQNIKVNSREPDVIRDAFVMCVRLLATKLYSRGLPIQRPPVPQTMKEIANDIREKMKDTDEGKMIAAIEQEAHDGNPEMLFELMKAMGKAISDAVAAQEHEP